MVHGGSVKCYVRARVGALRLGETRLFIQKRASPPPPFFRFVFTVHVRYMQSGFLTKQVSLAGEVSLRLMPPVML